MRVVNDSEFVGCPLAWSMTLSASEFAPGDAGFAVTFTAPCTTCWLESAACATITNAPAACGEFVATLTVATPCALVTAVRAGL